MEQNEDETTQPTADGVDPAEYAASVYALKALGDQSLLAAHPELADPETMRTMREGVPEMFGAAGVSEQDLVAFVANNPWVHRPLAQEFLFQAAKNYRALRKSKPAAALRAANQGKQRNE
jgi:hypothetical protein